MHPPAAKKESSLALENPAYKAVFAKIDRRLLPLLLIAYMVAYLRSHQNRLCAAADEADLAV